MVRLMDWEPFRRFFDDLLEEVMLTLPQAALAALDRVPLVVDDEPGARLLVDLGMEADEELYGLFTGTMTTERSVLDDAPTYPDQIMLFRGPIGRLSDAIAGETGADHEQVLREQIRVTLLHEFGHLFGLEEDDLDRLGFA